MDIAVENVDTDAMSYDFGTPPDTTEGFVTPRPDPTETKETAVTDTDTKTRKPRAPMTLEQAISRLVTVNSSDHIKVPPPIAALVEGKTLRWNLTETGLALDIVEPVEEEHLSIPSWAQ